jgi:hypothetical protein
MVVEAQMSTAKGGFKLQSWNKLVLLVSKDGPTELEKQGLIGVTKAQLQSSKKKNILHFRNLWKMWFWFWVGRGEPTSNS